MHDGFGGGATNHGNCGYNQGNGGYSRGSYLVNHSSNVGKSIAGYDIMPSPTGIGYINGNLGHGFIQISHIDHHSSNIFSCKCYHGIYIECSLIISLIYSLSYINA